MFNENKQSEKIKKKKETMFLGKFTLRTMFFFEEWRLIRIRFKFHFEKANVSTDENERTNANG